MSGRYDDSEFAQYLETRGDASPVAGYDLEQLKSDVNEQVWPSQPVEYDGPDQRHAMESVRTLSGFLDLLHHVVEESTEWVEREIDGPAHIPPRRRDKPLLLQTFARLGKSWRASSFTVGAPNTSTTQGVRIADARDFRRGIVVTNYGPGILYLSHMSGAVVGGPNMIQVAVNQSRDIPTEGEVWAYPAINGTPQTLDVLETYSVPEAT